jgi:hypothetical protein
MIYTRNRSVRDYSWYCPSAIEQGESVDKKGTLTVDVEGMTRTFFERYRHLLCKVDEYNPLRTITWEGLPAQYRNAYTEAVRELVSSIVHNISPESEVVAEKDYLWDNIMEWQAKAGQIVVGQYITGFASAAEGLSMNVVVDTKDERGADMRLMASGAISIDGNRTPIGGDWIVITCKEVDSNGAKFSLLVVDEAVYTAS